MSALPDPLVRRNRGFLGSDSSALSARDLQVRQSLFRQCLQLCLESMLRSVRHAPHLVSRILDLIPALTLSPFILLPYFACL